MEEEMAKRLRDTETYKDRFVKSLSPDYKHLWFYILDDCDHAGIWRVDIEGACLYTGCSFGPNPLEQLKEKVEVINEDYWFIPSFLKFQYGNEANEKAGVIISAKKRLAQFGLEGRLVLGKSTDTLPTPSQEGLETPKSKSKSKVKSIDKSKELTEEDKFTAGRKKQGKELRDYWHAEFEKLYGRKAVYVPAPWIQDVEVELIKQISLDELKQRADNNLRDGYLDNPTYTHFIKNTETFVTLRQKRVQGPKGEYESKRGTFKLPPHVVMPTKSNLPSF